MITIGAFAGITGITVKALRHYDEKGVLRPADVDPQTGYRRYGEEQVRSGAVVAALREAGVPLPAVAAALAGDGALTTLEQHRERVLAERRAEDAAHEAALRALRSYAVPADVVERSLPATPYVARLIEVTTDDPERGTDAANAAFGELFAALQTDGLGPAGTFWTGIREGSAPDSATLALAWPTTGRAPAGWGGEGVVVDELPARTELIATWRSRLDEELPEGSVHPAVVALFDALAARGSELQPGEVRQSMPLQSEAEFAVEVAITLA